MSAMSSMTVFRDERFGEVRTATINGEPWFVGKDVAEMLGYQNGSRDINRHVDEEDRNMITVNDGRQNRDVIIINESGLYSLILSSKLPAAKEFKRWVTTVILPALRKTGSYIVGEEHMDEDELIRQGYMALQRKLDLRTAQLAEAHGRLAQAESVIAKAEPAIDYYDRVAGSEGNMNFRETAKVLGVKEKYFIDLLLRKRFVYRNSHNKLIPYSDQIENGRFVVCEVLYRTSDGGERATPYAKITPKGRLAIHKLIMREAE